ncbi:MAG: hypothetical protein GXP42_02085 [Chloroflexi bacterium]|nr:hypothetical protein [Chloroflexota bacterium]
MKTRFFPHLLFLFLLALGPSACQKPTQPGDASSDRLVLSGPIEKRIPAGQFLPGTGIQYVGPTSDKGAEVRIDGQTAFKQRADSIVWKGSPMTGVEISLNQRVLTYNDDALYMAGVATIVIDGVSPTPLASPPKAAIEYILPVTYNVEVGQTAPGTTLTLMAIEPEQGAQFSGWSSEQYPYRRVADSVQWDGWLRQGVGLSLRLRVALLQKNSVQLVGLATLKLNP